MPTPIITDRANWLTARRALLAKEKAFTQARDALAAERRALPWVAVEEDYRFTDETGAHGLAELFGPCSQLIVQHFMLGQGWQAGCPSCSFWADGFDGMDIHLRHRDIAFVAVSSAPFEEIAAFKQRMGWQFRWLSAHGSDFNRDYGVSFTEAERETAEYNYRQGGFPATEAPGVSVFAKNAGGQLFHSYSCYARGLDPLNVAYQYIDLTPKGRDEAGLAYPMAWVRRHDAYEADVAADG